jgi:Cu2+-exporting ATPase
MARKVETVLFDKTGTLTKGEYGISKILTRDSSFSEEKILQLAASVESHSEHFTAKAIVKEAEKRKLQMLPVSDFQRLPGVGIKGNVEGKEVLVGGERVLEEKSLKLDENLKEKIKELTKQGKTVIFVLSGNQLVGLIALSDLIREESKEAVKELKNLGIKVAMITGDSENVASWVAKELGIDEYFANVLPQDKAGKVRLLQEKGYKVAMVGDGVNDAPALVQADLGIAIGAGTNVAIESAGIILVRNDPRDIVKIIKLSRATYNKMLQNLFWATGYNVVAIPLAAGVLYSKGIVLQPAFAAVLMSLSTVIVAVNAMLLKKKKLD